MEKEYRSYVEIEVVSKIQNLEEIGTDVEELSWDHSKEACQMIGIPIGSEEFIEIYKELNKNYKISMDHIKFFMLTAMLTTKKLLENGLVTIPLGDNEDPSTEDVSKKIAEITHNLMSSYMWLVAGKDVLWPSNDDLADEIKVTYLFEVDNIKREEY